MDSLRVSASYQSFLALFQFFVIVFGSFLFVIVCLSFFLKLWLVEAFFVDVPININTIGLTTDIFLLDSPVLLALFHMGQPP